MDESTEEIFSRVKVYPWRNKKEFVDTYDLIYSPTSTTATKKKAFDLLMIWKLRKAQETPNNILCTYALLEAHLKDEMKIIKGISSLCTIYGSALTKFVNCALSSIPGNMSMYRAAESLGIESYIIDIRHLCSHGTQSPQLEVFRSSNIYCLQWLKTHYWEKEIEKLENCCLKDLKSQAQLAHEAQAAEMFLVLDTTIEGLSKGFVSFEDVENDETWTEARKNILKNCLGEFESTKLTEMKNYVRDWLIKALGTKTVRDYSRPFFQLFIQKCEYIMKTLVEDKKNETSEEPPSKKVKKCNSSKLIVKQHIKFFIRELVCEGFLSEFIQELFQIFNNSNEFEDKRNVARKWIIILLESFKAYRDWCDLQESLDNVLSAKKVDKKIEKTYTEELQLDLDKIFIFAGCRVLPTSLKIRKSILTENLNNLNAFNKEICECLLPFIVPPISPEKSSMLHNVIQIQTQEVRKSEQPSQDVFTAADMKEVLKIDNSSSNENSEGGWKLSTADINWSTVPIGTLFS